MEQETVLKEILHALDKHSVRIEQRFTEMDSKMDNMKTELESKMDNMRTELESKMDNMRTELEFKMDNMRAELESKMDKGFDRLGKKVDGVRVDLTETQETTDYVVNKTIQHEKKLRELTQQQQ